MSKHNPNQDFYKIGGRSQSDGPDRADVHDRKSSPKDVKRQEREGEENFIPGEAPVGESKKK